MKNLNVDIAIIGAGTAGLAAVKEIRKVSNNFIIINNGPVDTTCLRSGCMPTKVFLNTARAFAQRYQFDDIGIKGSKHLSLDIPHCLKHVRSLREYFLSHLKKEIEDLKPYLIDGFAKFISAQELKVGKQYVKAKKIVIATGSSLFIPDNWKKFSDFILTSDNFFEQDNLPQKIAVIGLGALGLEMAEALHSMNIEVIGISKSSEIGWLTDPKINNYVICKMKEKMPIWLEHEANLSLSGEGIQVTAGADTVIVDKVFVAMGRSANLAGLGLEDLGIISNTQPLPKYDELTMQIEDFPIYIAGDATRNRLTLHESENEGKIAGYNAAQQFPNKFKRYTKLKIVSTNPEIAIIGKAWKELKIGEYESGEINFEDQGKSVIIGKNIGYLRIYAKKSTGLLLGAELYAPKGEHLAHLIAWLIDKKLTVKDALSMPFYHPTVEEGLYKALCDLEEKIYDII
jgi:dihydrolipoamide dehydrogenase